MEGADCEKVSPHRDPQDHLCSTFALVSASFVDGQPAGRPWLECRRSGLRRKHYRPLVTDDEDKSATLERWRQDVLDTAQSVWALNARRVVFVQMDAELEREGSESATWFRYRFLRPLYGEAQAVGVRRLVDNDWRARSFVRLLAEMIEQPELLSREQYLELFFERRPGGPDDEDEIRLANDLFDDLAGEGAEHVSAEALKAIRDEIVADGERIKAHVDQYVAHHDRKPDFDPATWVHLSTAIDDMANALGRIGRVVDGVDRFGTPTFQFDWTEFLQRGLFKRPLSDPQLDWPEYSPKSFE